MAFPHEKAITALSWVCLVPFLIALVGVGWKARGAYGLLYGILYTIPGHWTTIYEATAQKHWPVWVTTFSVAFFFFCYIVPFVVFSLGHPWVKRDGFGRAWRLSAFLAVMIAWMPTYFSVTPADMIHDWPYAIQIADFGGMPILVQFLVLVNALLAETILLYPHRKAMVFNGLALLGVTVAVLGYGALRIHSLQRQEAAGQGRSIHIAAVQTRLTPYDTMASVIRNNSSRRFSAIEWSRYAVEDNPETELIVWPEIPMDLTYKNRTETLYEKVSEFAARNKVPVLFNCIETVYDTDPPSLYTVASFMQADGTTGPFYRKRVLTPFYEYNPLRNWLDFGHFPYLPGESNLIIDLGQGRYIIPAICYEIHSARHIRDFVLQGGNIITHLANFNAFGDGPINFIDLTMAKFRAIEHRVPIVRACNHGYGVFIDATGRIVPGSLNSPKQRTALTFPLFIPDRRAPYTTLGDFYLYLLTVVVVVDFILSVLQRPKSPKTINELSQA